MPSSALPTDAATPLASVLFVGGGNMATAIIGGLRRREADAAGVARRIVAVDPSDMQRSHLARGFDVEALPALGDVAGPVDAVVWAVKPQQFAEASGTGGRWPGALHLSVMAGVRRATIGRATGASRIVRAMPNTPALIGHGITGLVGDVPPADRHAVDTLLAATGGTVWLADEADLDAVTALSGSGPAYVFYLLEAMIDAGRTLGLDADIARRLALATVEGAAQQALRSTEPVDVLRQRVTSKGGTTHAAITLLDHRAVRGSIVDAIRAARDRATALGRELDGA